MPLSIWSAVAAGGAIGSLLRYFIGNAIYSVTGTGFSWGIFVVNISGGFVMGVLTKLMALKINIAPELCTFLVVGIMGGYTTFSLDSTLLIERGAYTSAAAYVAGSALLSILALFAGLWLVRAL